MITLFRRAFVFAFLSIALSITPNIQAGTLSGASVPLWYLALLLRSSYEQVQFTRDIVTIGNADGTKTIIRAPTFDITENPDSFSRDADGKFIPDADGKIRGTGSALFKGTMKITHGPAPELGDAWAEFQMRWPEIEIIIEPQSVTAQHANGTEFTYIKESRVYRVILDGDTGASAINTDKMSDGYKLVDPDLPKSGVYEVCDGTKTHAPAINPDGLCYYEIGYGDTAFNPFELFQEITTASGQTLDPNVGFYWDEVCLAFEPQDIGVSLDGLDFILKEDIDGYFRSCEGRSVAFNACSSKPVPVSWVEGDPVSFDCNALNEDGDHFTFVLAHATAGDRLEPTPTATCIGSDVADWLSLAEYSGSGEDLVVVPCDPNQDSMQLPYYFTDSSIWFTTSEGDSAQIDNLQIIRIMASLGDPAAGTGTPTTIYLQESPDKTDSFYDFSKIIMNNIASIQSLELDDTVIGTVESDVIIAGNGDDQIFGFSGHDCLEGSQNNDALYGDIIENVTGNYADPVRGNDVYIIHKRLGKDDFFDFNGDEDGEGNGDRVANISGTTITADNIVDNGDGTYTITVKGQNVVTVHAVPGGFDPARDIVQQSTLSGNGVDEVNFTQCSGHPSY